MELTQNNDSMFKNIIRQMVRVSKSAFGLSNNVSTLSRNIHEQSQQILNVQSENRETLDEVTNIRDRSNSLADTAMNADASSRSGREKQMHYLEELQRLSDSIEKGTLFINDFKKKSEDINTMTSLIMDISERLDILAINGAIEAARQGSSGAGFTVITREMKKMAEETKLSAERVETIVKQFDSSSSEIQSLFSDSRDSLRDSRSEADSIYRIFGDIENRNSLVLEEADSIRQLVDSLVKRNDSRETSARVIMDGARISTSHIEEVDRESDGLQSVVKTILEEMGEIRLDWHQNALDSVKSIAGKLETVEGEYNGCLHDCFRDFPFIELIYVMDGKGIQIEDNVVNPEFIDQIEGGGKGADRSSRSYVRKLSENNNSYISGIYLSSAVSQLCLTISVCFSGQTGPCILAADLNLEHFVEQN